MKAPVHYSRGRVVYTGRMAWDRYSAWAESGAGRSVLEQVASRSRFSLFGPLRTAGRRVWRQLTSAARSEKLIPAMQHEVDSYLARLDTLAYAQDLPRASIDGYRLVVVPRAFVNACAYRGIDVTLRLHPEFLALDGGESLRDWWVLTVIEAIEAAVARARPSLKRPLPAGNGWVAVSLDERFEWRIAADGVSWPGHYYVLELPRTPMKRAFRKAASEALTCLHASLPSLSRARRNEIVSQAGSSIARLTKRAV